MGSLRETFIDELRDLYDAEKQLLQALPKMAKAAENEELKAAFEEHIEQTEGQIERLEQVFEAFGETVRGKKCAGMAGLIKEGNERIQEKAGDAALICAAQKAEHYEIAAYGSLRAWANLMEEGEVAGLLEESLEEESQTDKRLTEIAETAVNIEEEEGEEESEQDRGQRRKSRSRSKSAAR